jgi:T-complex protein 1 subunit delta
MAKPSSTGSSAGERYSDNKLKHDIRMSNMNAAKQLADAIRTSLGPRGGGCTSSVSSTISTAWI